MTNLKRGTLYISYEDILNHMNLSKDTHLIIRGLYDGVEIDVTANGNNEHDWLVENTGENNTWNLRRTQIQLIKAEDVARANRLLDN